VTTPMRCGMRVVIDDCACGLGATGNTGTHNGEMGIVTDVLCDDGLSYAIVDWGGTHNCRCRAARPLTRS
jgi:hypothetical protein